MRLPASVLQMVRAAWAQAGVLSKLLLRETRDRAMPAQHIRKDWGLGRHRRPSVLGTSAITSERRRGAWSAGVVSTE